MKPLLFVGFAAALCAASASAQNIDTIAGTGASGFSGDGGPALLAEISQPRGVAVAPDGTVFFADNFNARVRTISPDGIISTFAGDGQFGDSGDDGQATAASLSNVLTIALDTPSDSLYISDASNSRIRRVDLATGVITHYAGTIGGFGYNGDGIPAATAELAGPEGIAADAAGNLYVADLFNCRVRRIDAATTIITTITGNGFCQSSGDGGPATDALVSAPTRVAVDGDGNVFFIDIGATQIVRRIDTSGIISTVAGGGVGAPGSGPATSIYLASPGALTTSSAGHVFIGNLVQILEVDPTAGTLSVFAGLATEGFSGDGGPATSAEFNQIGGLAFAPDGALIVSDTGNNRVRAIGGAAALFDLIIELLTSQSFLDSVASVPGSVLLVNVDGRELLIVPNATSVGLNVNVIQSDQLLIIDLSALASVGGSIDISGNLALTTIDLTGLLTVGGSVNIGGNPNLSTILIQNVTSIAGDLSLIATVTTIIDIALLQTVGGSLTISDNNVATNIQLTNLTTVGGDVTLTGNTAATAVGLGALTSVGGNVTIADNTSASGVSLGALQSVGGNVTISGNDSAAAVGLGGLTSVGGDVTIVDNGGAAVGIGALTSVGGNVTIESTGTGTFSGGSPTIVGNETLILAGYDAATSATAGGITTVENSRDDAVMNATLPAGSFTSAVSFTITRLDPATLAPEGGFDAAGGPAIVDPVAAYQFMFAVPTLNSDATLSFDIVLAGLDGATQAAVLDAVSMGSITMATKGDAAGSMYQAFPICGGAEVPMPDGCVKVESLDAAGNPTSGTPDIVRFSNVVGHFSIWAVAIVTPARITITPSIIQLFPNASKKVHIEGTLELNAGRDGIDPATELVALRLFFPKGSRIYPVGTDKMPVGLVPITGGWSISDAEKTRTGIQDFQILQTGDPSFFVFKLVDTRTSLPQGDYSQVRVELQIGNDMGTVDAVLVQVSNGNWKLG
jgi:sugar lactone lactonase YvrE